MDNVFLMSSGKVSFKTVDPGIGLEELKSGISIELYEEIKNLYPNNKFHIYGVKKKTDFDKIKVSDYAWFCSNNEYHTLSKVIYKVCDKMLSSFLWNDEDYEQIIFLDNIIKTKVKRIEVQGKVELKAGYNRFGVHYLDLDKSKILIESYELDKLTGDLQYIWDDTNKFLKKKTVIVETVEQYIQSVNKIIDINDNSKLFVYRGEKKDYGHTSCMPNIFREKQYLENDNYESSLYNDMYSKGIVPKQSSLETAIEAQHGGFPSRLLDVSYNALIALYFATEYKEWEEVEGNAIITIFNIDEIYIPGAHNSEELFEEIIDSDSKIRRLNISAFNHKLIDHMNKNERIKSQQGAFILFQGKEYRPIPEVMYKKIEIKKEAVKKIHKQLDKLFGINVGKIYPEPHNQIELIKARNKFINSNNYSLENEFEIALKMFKRINEKRYFQMKKYINVVIDGLERNAITMSQNNKIVYKINQFEESILVFKYDYIKSLKELKVILRKSKNTDFLINNKVYYLINEYNDIVKILFDKLSKTVDELGLESSGINELLIRKEDLKNQHN